MSGTVGVCSVVSSVTCGEDECRSIAVAGMVVVSKVVFGATAAHQ